MLFQLVQPGAQKIGVKPIQMAPSFFAPVTLIQKSGLDRLDLRVDGLNHPGIKFQGQGPKATQARSSSGGTNCSPELPSPMAHTR